MNSVVEPAGRIVLRLENVSTLPLNPEGFAGLRYFCDEPFDISLFTYDVYVIGNGQGSLI